MVEIYKQAGTQESSSDLLKMLDVFSFVPSVVIPLTQLDIIKPHLSSLKDILNL